ncbi:MAG: hypothetical protein MRY57_00290 [Candidatus Pacebacteria bacterium]|nr:hypothetical protein [Candidatus Paceibacterota bacterium]
MLIQQLVDALGSVFLQIPPFYYLLIFLFVMAGSIIVSIIFHYHIQKYTFRDYKTGLMRLVFISGLGILSTIALILLGLIFRLS